MAEPMKVRGLVPDDEGNLVEWEGVIPEDIAAKIRAGQVNSYSVAEEES